jgi:parallel beta-helix repeat protein
MGFDISDGAGPGLLISGNLIEDSATHGISVSVNGTASQPNVITGNTIRRSGHHGMEIRGSWWQIERNTVSASGQSIAGTSGIHLYSAAATEDSGDHNLVRYNLSFNNADTGASDGNGIQVDHWCDNNTVSFNLAWGNDGAGINVYEAQNNLVFGNTVRGNGLDPGGSHGALGEIIVGAAADNNRTAGNQVFDNIAVATRANVPAIYVDGRAYGSANTVGPNLLQNTAGGTVLRWGDNLNRNTAPQIDSATSTTGNLVEAPAFRDANAPASGAWQLSAKPSGNGLTLTDQTDLAGAVSVGGLAFFGAYFTGP